MRILWGLFLLFTMVLSSQTLAAEIFTLDGYWLTKKGDAVVRMSACEEGSSEYCGWIYWLRDDAPKHDLKHPNVKLRGRSLCGTRAVHGFTAGDKTNNWGGGFAYKASEGKTYKAKAWMETNERIDFRGYVGIPALGKTTYLTRVKADDYEECKKLEPVKMKATQKKKSFNQ